MRVNMCGTITVTPCFLRRKEKQKEKSKKRISLLLSSADPAENFFKNEIQKQSYDRKNKITEIGTTLRAAARTKIKNAIFHKYYSTRGDYSRKMKFFTYTVDANQYEKYFTDYYNSKKNLEVIEQDEYYRNNSPITWKDHVKKLRSELSPHPDQIYIKKFSDHLENLQKRERENIESYVWVAEKTDRGIIHFHCIFETKFLYHQKESEAWSKRCGFENHKNSVQYGIDRKSGRIENKNNGGVMDPKIIASYITKYCTKNKSIVFGRIYGMSKGFVEHAHKGSDSFQMPEFFIRNKETGDSVISFSNPKKKFDFDTGEVTEGSFLNAKLLSTKFIACKAGNIPIYVFACDRENILKQAFPELYPKVRYLFEKEKSKSYGRKPKKNTHETSAYRSYRSRF